MAARRVIATIEHMTPVPPRSVWQGDGLFDFKADKLPTNVKEMFVEFNPDDTVKSRKPGYVVPPKPTKPVKADK